jgi:hypothetical protein
MTALAWDKRGWCEIEGVESSQLYGGSAGSCSFLLLLDSSDFLSSSRQGGTQKWYQPDLVSFGN